MARHLITEKVEIPEKGLYDIMFDDKGFLRHEHDYSERNGRKIPVIDESTTWVMEDWYFTCAHEREVMETRELDLSSWEVLVCLDCGKELSE